MRKDSRETLQKSEEDIQREKRVNASCLYSQGICKTGTAAFARDHGVDSKGSYKAFL